MRIENTNNLQHSFDTAAEQLNGLVSARDTLYEKLNKLYTNESYTDSDRTEHEAKLRSTFANTKKSVLAELQSILEDIHSWDVKRTRVRSAMLDETDFKSALQIAASIGTTATREVVEAVILLGKNRTQTAALCSILADKCTDEAAKQAISDKVYSPDTYYAEAARKLTKYISDDDYRLEDVAGLFRDVCYKVNDAETFVVFNVAAFTDEAEPIHLTELQHQLLNKEDTAQ